MEAKSLRFLVRDSALAWVTHFFYWRGMIWRIKKPVVFLGHRKIADKEQVRERLYIIIEEHILCKNVETFLLGSKSAFDDLCREILAELRKKYQHIRRVYVRAEYPFIDDNYKAYLLEYCEDTYFPERAIHAGRGSYIERNCAMIDRSEYCIIYYKHDYIQPSDYQSKSGTFIAYEYAVRKGKEIINTA